MSHFTVLVIHEPDEDMAELLAPYDENTQVDPHKERIAADDVKRVAKDAVGDDAIRAALTDYYELSADKDDEGWFYLSTYNPDSKWDWWVVGGRWGNYFDVKPEHDGDPRLVRGQQPAIGVVTTEPGKTDGGPKGLLDLDGMRERAAREAGAAWDKVHAVIDKHPPARTWADFIADVEAGTISIDAARNAYREQPRIAAFNAIDNDPFSSIDPFEVDRGLYVERARAGAVPGWATLYKGEWIEQGRMGMWAFNDATDGSRAGYWEHVNGLIDGLSDDTYLTVVDCHI